MNADRIALVEEAIAAIAAGKMVVVVDDEDRENEGDFVFAASLATPESIAFLLDHASGYICVAMTGERLDELEIPLMVRTNTARLGTAMTVTVDALEGTTTGISSFDRAMTLQKLADPASQSDDFARPGHIQPLRAVPGGVLERTGHTEAGIDLVRLAGLPPVAGICEVISADKLGMARLPELSDFAEQHRIPLISIADLVEYRMHTESVPFVTSITSAGSAVVRTSGARLPTSFGNFRCVAYESQMDGKTHLAVVAGQPEGLSDVMVRVHSECLTGDVLGSRRCDCGEQLEESLRVISEAEHGGVVIYLRGHEGRGVGLAHKVAAYELQDQGFDTVDANTELGLPVDSREYRVAAEILTDLDVTRVRLLTNNPTKRLALEQMGIEVVDLVPLRPQPNVHNIEYLRTKAEKLGHLLEDLTIDALNGHVRGIADGPT